MEGGPLLPVRTELYQSALGAQALHALSNLAHLAGKDDLSQKLAQEFARQEQLVDHTFWSPEKKTYAYALDQNSQRMDAASVLATVPLWFGLLDQDNAQPMIDQLADADHQTDWGMRIISSQNPMYDPGGYHFGSVWPLFTGWAAVGEYRYHRAVPAYSNLRSNALLALDGALGHVTEVLSGDYYQPLSTSSPHQIWSAAMVVSPMLRGLLGLETDATSHELRFAPHVPAGWKSFEVRNVHVAGATLDLKYQRTEEGLTLEMRRTGSGDCLMEFSPALSPRAEVSSAEINGRPVSLRVERNSEDQHVVLRFPVPSGPSTLRIRVRNDFGYDVSSNLPRLGERSQSLRVLSESWGPKYESLTVNVSGIAGKQYDLSLWNSRQIASVEGGKLIQEESGQGRIRVELPGTDLSSYVHAPILIRFAVEGSARKKVAKPAKSAE